jgi:hypothetical protein
MEGKNNSPQEKNENKYICTSLPNPKKQTQDHNLNSTCSVLDRSATTKAKIAPYFK